MCVCVCVSGYTCEPHNNPADFFLDVINGDSTAVALNKLYNNDGTTISLPQYNGHFSAYFSQELICFYFCYVIICNWIYFYLSFTVFSTSTLTYFSSVSCQGNFCILVSSVNNSNLVIVFQI